MNEQEKILARYKGKILGVRNYEAEKENFSASDFSDQGTFLDFIWEVSEGESDFTPAGVAFVKDYFDLRSVAEYASQKGFSLPPDEEGESKKQRIKNFIDYMDSIEPMETMRFIAESELRPKGMHEELSLEDLHKQYLPPEERD